MPFLFFLLLVLSIPTAFASTNEAASDELPMQVDPAGQGDLLVTEFKPQDPTRVNRSPGILHEPIVDEEASAVAREDSAILDVLNQSSTSED